MLPTPEPISTIRRPIQRATRSYIQRLYASAVPMRSRVSAPKGSAAARVLRFGCAGIVPRKLSIECRGIDAEHLGRPGLVPALGLKHPHDVGPLDGLEHGVVRWAVAHQGLTLALGDALGQRGNGDLAIPAEDRGVL